jgi:hypothetical protein
LPEYRASTAVANPASQHILKDRHEGDIAFVAGLHLPAEFGLVADAKPAGLEI